MDRWKDTQDEKILGMTDLQFDLAFFLVIGVAALGAFLFGFAHALGILGDDQAPSPQVAAEESIAPVASSVVQAPTSEDGEASSSPSAADADEDSDATLRDLAPFLGILPALVVLVTVIVVLTFIGGDRTDSAVS